METFDPAIAGLRSPLAVAARIAAPQHGIVARRQLLRAGLTDHRRAFETDRLRDQRLLAAGWRVARVTDWQMTDLRADTAERFTALLRPAS